MFQAFGEDVANEAFHLGRRHALDGGEVFEQRLGERAGCREALRRITLERLHDDRFELGRVPGTHGRGRRDLELQDAAGGLRVGHVLEEAQAEGRFPQDDAEREDVDAAIQRSVSNLLRRHVRDGAHEHAGPCLREGVHRSRDPEVGDANDPVVADHDVLRRDVAVDDAPRLAVGVDELVRRVQALRRRRDDVRREARGELAAVVPGRAEQQRERLAAHVVHREEVPTVVDVDLVDRHDVRVVDGRGDARLVEEHLDERRLTTKVRVDDLQREQSLEAAEPAGAPEVERGHRPLSELAQHPVAPDARGELASAGVGEDLGHSRPTYQEPAVVGGSPPDNRGRPSEYARASAGFHRGPANDRIATMFDIAVIENAVLPVCFKSGIPGIIDEISRAGRTGETNR